MESGPLARWSGMEDERGGTGVFHVIVRSFKLDGGLVLNWIASCFTELLDWSCGQDGCCWNERLTDGSKLYLLCITTMES